MDKDELLIGLEDGEWLETLMTLLHSHKQTESRSNHYTYKETCRCTALQKKDNFTELKENH